MPHVPVADRSTDAARHRFGAGRKTAEKRFARREYEQPLADMLGSVTRVMGQDRYETSAAISKKFFPNGSKTVYLASGALFPDALTSGAVAGGAGAPTLLTATRSLPPAIAAEIDRLNPHTVIILGGTGAVSTQVQQQIKELLTN